MLPNNVIEFAQANQDRFIEELKDLVRIPSISSSKDHVVDVHRCAEFLKDMMLEIGLERVDIYETPGHPVVFGEWMGAPGKPTIIIYGHYDVQPVDPLDLWETPPFEPDIRDGRMYGRGTVDDKGQVYIHIKAIESWMKTHDALPLNIKFIVEGEEEIGSQHLEHFLEPNREMLSADYAVISDTPMIRKGYPSICYGLRGLAYFQINLRGSKQDLHSGSYGGSVINPIHALSKMLTKLKEENGRILIPGFYEDVVDVSPGERKALALLPFDEESYREEIGVKKLFGESGYSILENIWCRPSLDVCGIWGGFTGEGSKTIIPSEAHAKVSMRLVPNQTPGKIAELFESYIHSITPPEVEITIDRMHGGMPYLTDTNHQVFMAAITALKKGFNADAVFIREGGSIPIVQTFQETLNIPCLLLGFGLPNENAHAPNEWLDLENFKNGILSCIYLYEEISNLTLD